MSSLQLQHVLLSDSKPLLALLQHLAVFRKSTVHSAVFQSPDPAVATPTAATTHRDLSQQQQHQQHWHQHSASSSRSLFKEATPKACGHATSGTAQHRNSRSRNLLQAYPLAVERTALSPLGAGTQLRGFAASAAAAAFTTSFPSNSGASCLLCNAR